MLIHCRTQKQQDEKNHHNNGKIKIWDRRRRDSEYCGFNGVFALLFLEFRLHIRCLSAVLLWRTWDIFPMIILPRPSRCKKGVDSFTLMALAFLIAGGLMIGGISKQLWTLPDSGRSFARGGLAMCYGGGDMIFRSMTSARSSDFCGSWGNHDSVHAGGGVWQLRPLSNRGRNIWTSYYSAKYSSYMEGASGESWGEG